MTLDIISKEAALSLEENGVDVKQTIQDMVLFAKSMTVENDGSFKSMTSLYRQARDWKKLIEEKRKGATEPFRRQTSAINDKAKELSEPLTTVEEIAKMKVDGYQKMLEQKKEIEDAKIREAAAILDIDENLYIPPIEKSIRGEGAMAYTKVEKKFRLSDISKVPAKYLKLDEQAIKQDIKFGVNEIPGLEIYEEKSIQLRSR